jgi:hypothetical protein
MRPFEKNVITMSRQQMQHMTSPLQELKAGIAASAALSDDDLLAKVTEMSPESFEEFLFSTKLQALVEMASGAVPL